jgi:hypothetical protein
MGRAAYLAVISMVFAATSAEASDANPLGFYFGAAAGRADVRATTPQFGLNFDEHPTGWKVFGGLRPIPLIGVELDRG